MRFLSASHCASYEANVIGSSPTWNRVYQMVQQVAPSPATVLLTGRAGRGRNAWSAWCIALAHAPHALCATPPPCPPPSWRRSSLGMKRAPIPGRCTASRGTASWLTGGLVPGREWRYVRGRAGHALAGAARPDLALPAKATLAPLRRAAMLQALHQTAGDREATARLFHMGVATLYRLVKKYRMW